MSMIRIALVPALVAGALTFETSEARAEDPLIGYVNLQRAILEVEEGKRAKAQLKKTFDKKQKALSKQEAELKALQDKLEKSAGKNDDATRKQRVDFQQKLMELQQVFMTEQQELAKLEQKTLAGITKKMRGVISDIGRKGKYTLILEVQENRLLFGKPHLDLTNEVIRKYNQKFK